MEVDSNIDLHRRQDREFSIDPNKGYVPDEKDTPLLASILQQLCPDRAIDQSGIKRVHVGLRRITIFHRHAIKPASIRDQVVEVLPIHYEDYVFESDFANGN